MKQTCPVILTLLLVAVVFSSNSFAQDYIHYAILSGHTDEIWSVSFSPDGKTLASGSWDKTIRLWDVDTNLHLRTLIGHTGKVRGISFSPDGKTLASGSHDKTIRLWDVGTGKHLRTLIGHASLVWDVSFSPDGKTLASGSLDTTLRLWNVSTGRSFRTLTGHTHIVSDVLFSPDGQTLASGSFDDTIRLWNVMTGGHLRTLTGHNSTIQSISFSPDGQKLASGSFDDTIRLWDVGTGKHLQTFIGHSGGVESVSFSPDGQKLASSGWDGTVQIWDAVFGTRLKVLTGYNFRIWSVAYSPDGRTLASGGYDKTIRLWRVSHPLSANQIYDNAIRSVMWIVNPGIGEGSGILIDKQFKLAITNAHVAGEQNTVDIYFPAPDEKGELIKDRNFYLTNGSVLKRLGYYTKGHVVARDEETDLAIIRLDGLPETAREIDWNFTTPKTNIGDLVYILGNPGGQELWRWTLGEYLKDHGDFLHIQSDVFGGNSGGPVLNKQGVLIGIVARSDRHMNALAIPVRDINRLLSESRLEHSRSRR